MIAKKTIRPMLIRLHPAFIKKRFEVNKKCEIEVTPFMNMLTGFSEWIFSPMRIS